MHEFGHTIGLTDLYEEKDSSKYIDYLMHATKNRKHIPAVDIAMSNKCTATSTVQSHTNKKVSV